MSGKNTPNPIRIERITPELIRYLVMRLWRESKHLQLVDCFALTTDTLLHGHFYYRLRPGELRPEDLSFWGQVALWNMVNAVPDLAWSCGYLPRLEYRRTLSVHDTLFFALGRESQWDEDVYTPAIEAAQATNGRADLNTRFGEVYFHWSEIQKLSVFRRAAWLDKKDVAKAVQKNVGDGKHGVEEFSGPECAAWLDYISDHVPHDQAFEIGQNGEILFQDEALDNGLIEVFDDAVKFPKRLKSLDAESKFERNESLASRTGDQGAVDPPLALLARELRDELDTFDHYPLLREEAALAVRDPGWFGFENIQSLLELRDALDELEDRALQAAVVYERSRLGFRAHGGVGRNRVGLEYGVSPRQIERREAEARKVLRRLAA